jgi:hypothetical protein
MYALAAFWKSVFPGSFVEMCHHSIVTGAPVLASALAAEEGGAALGA